MELYEGDIRFTDTFVSFYRSKGKRISKNPILPELRDVLKKYPDGLPEFVKIQEYRSLLKDIAEHFKWDRIIEEPNTSVKPNSNTFSLDWSLVTK